MAARIYKPARTAMQSGTACSRHWLLEFSRTEPRRLDPLMGWTGSSDTQAQVRISFESKEAAIAYAEAHGIAFTVQQPAKRKPVIRKRGYAENFAYERRDSWTH